MGNLTSKTTFKAEVYEKLIDEIPEKVKTFIQLINEDNNNFDQSKLQFHCYNFINNLLNSNMMFPLDDVYVGGISAGLTAYILSFGVSGAEEHQESVVNYVKLLVSIINKQ